MKEIGLLGAAIALDLLIGDPPNIPHPIRYIGNWIKFLERNIRNHFSNLRWGGLFLTVGSVAMTVGTIRLLLWGSSHIGPVFSDCLKVYIVYTALAAKCLDVEARKVYRELKNGDLAGARKKIGYLVGRDTSKLDMDGVTRAAVETVAENTVDGILAPLFYLAIGFFLGIPAELIYMYKTVNTLDSMVGYKNEKYKDIGFVSAKLDDVLNYIPARVGSLAMVLAGAVLGYDYRSGFAILKRDRKNHKSPNCGYPESAVAGLLNIQLGGTNIYFGEKVCKPTIGDKKRNTEPGDILKTIKIMYLSEFIFVVFFVLAYLAKTRC